MPPSNCSPFARTYDAVVVGSGYAGFAAAISLRAGGHSVLLLNAAADLLWESGRAFMTDMGSGSSALWSRWSAELATAEAHRDGRCDGAGAELLAVRWLRSEGVEVLFYKIPVAVELVDELLTGVIVAGKDGCHRVLGRRFIDATETGALCRLLAPDWRPVTADRLRLAAFYHGGAWPAAAVEFDPDTRLTTTVNEGERCLQRTLPGSADIWPSLIDLGRSAHAAQPALMAGSVMSHCSVEGFPLYDARQRRPAVPDNVVVAVPACAAASSDLASRFACGERAAAELQQCPSSAGTASGAAVPPVVDTEATADIVVAGAGTGGAMAAVAAGRRGVRVICVEPLRFAGGIGAGGGIHWYYFGVTGGLQAEMDDRVREVMTFFGSPGQVMGFHPDVKKMVLAQMLDEAGVELRTGTTVFAAETADDEDGKRIEAVLAAGAAGVTRIRATAFVDSTGDGDLCAMAGAGSVLGRVGDGRLHAYSQSGGRIAVDDKGRSKMVVVNFDAGWVDPTSSEDLTRGRLTALGQYGIGPFAATARPTYLAPAIGLRQGRQIETDYMLQLSDLIEHRRFADAIGFTGSHYDNHAGDYEFESDEGLFWVWVCGAWRQRTACEMPYRMLIPRALTNAWVGCRAAGISADAHHSCRMQRDAQRLGEVAGLAAALSLPYAGASRKTPFRELRQALLDSGALDPTQTDIDLDFGPYTPGSELVMTADGLAEEAVAQGLQAVRSGAGGEMLWYAYRAGAAVADELADCLTDTSADVSWYAACVLALQGDARAEPRLLAAIADREDCRVIPKDAPWMGRFSVERWLTAVCLLRCCGTDKAIACLTELAGDAALTLHLRCAIALTGERLGQRFGDKVAPIADALVQHAPAAAVLEPPNPRIDSREQDESKPGHIAGDTREDHAWQLHLAIARLRARLGQPLHAAAESCLQDPRSLVRRAFAALPAS